MKILGLVLACGMLGTSVNAVTDDPTANAQNFAAQKIAQKRQERAQFMRDREDMSIAARDSSTPEALQAAMAGLRPSGQPMMHDHVKDFNVYVDTLISDIRTKKGTVPANSDLAQVADATIEAIQALEKLRLLSAVRAGALYNWTLEEYIKGLYKNIFTPLFSNTQGL